LNTAKILVGDNRASLKTLPEKYVQTVVTSPPYWGLRDYGNDNQLGLEATPEEFIENLCQVFDEVWRVLKDDGTLWVNLGDSYVGTGSKGDFKDPKNPNGRNGQIVALNNKVAGLKSKDLVGIPWRFAFAMQARGWYLRQDIIWAKPNPMPESVTDRCTKSHEYIFLLTKSARYFYDNVAIKEPASTEPQARDKNAEGYQADYAGGDRFSAGERVFGADGMRNKRDVWTVATKPYSGAHFAVYPPELIKPCVLAGSREGDIILDPFSGSGTTGEVALQNGRNYIGLELSPDYAALSEARIGNAVGMFGSVSVEQLAIK
jgi:DNA modification methylase